ncbi:MmcQ/YjbR family DNA-binding protein [Saccharibacillus kuerlensis]|uniref:MmcQ/YjbR family DNA-binding protein n=1 Tax=Saccharibacillus kuerlensis TaxID=459527 RepID=UPI0012EED8F7|nr:MmcQ/YjbR family DNA-binding protein [Saccharibacillus kuerlensis]
MNGRTAEKLNKIQEIHQILTLKCDPMLAEEYKERYKQIVPGYDSNKSRWNSILLEEGGLETEFAQE